MQQTVLEWLIAFEFDALRHAVLDWDWLICGEYQNKLTDQDYGWLALMAKKDRDEVVWVGLATDADGHAMLPDSLADSITDLADRKMAAAVLKAQGEGHPSNLVNACDTDWLDCAAALVDHGIGVEHVIEDWLRAKWEKMRTGG